MTIWEGIGALLPILLIGLAVRHYHLKKETYGDDDSSPDEQP